MKTKIIIVSLLLTFLLSNACQPQKATSNHLKNLLPDVLTTTYDMEDNVLSGNAIYYNEQNLLSKEIKILKRFVTKKTHTYDDKHRLNKTVTSNGVTEDVEIYQYDETDRRATIFLYLNKDENNSSAANYSSTMHYGDEYIISSESINLMLDKENPIINKKTYNCGIKNNTLTMFVFENNNELYITRTITFENNQITRLVELDPEGRLYQKTEYFYTADGLLDYETLFEGITEKESITRYMYIHPERMLEIPKNRRKPDNLLNMIYANNVFPN